MRFLIVTFMLVCVAPVAQAQYETAEEFLQRPNTEFKERHLATMAEGIEWYNSYLVTKMKQTGAFCPPDNLSITRTQYLSIFKVYVEKNPRGRDNPVGMALLNSLIYAFPCKG
jgi:hypothetical protein